MYNSFFTQNQYLNSKRTAGLGLLIFLENTTLNPFKSSFISTLFKNLGFPPVEDQDDLYCSVKDSTSKTGHSNSSQSSQNILQMRPDMIKLHSEEVMPYLSADRTHYQALHITMHNNYSPPTGVNYATKSYLPTQNSTLSYSGTHVLQNLLNLDLLINNSLQNISFSYITKPAISAPIKPSSELTNWLTSFGAGFLAGTVARTSTAPFDRLKFIYQLYYKGSDKPPSLSTGFREIIKRDGFRGLFRGNLMCVLKASPETSIRLTVFEKLKSLIKDEKTGLLSKDKLFIAAGVSGALANLAIFPMDVLRTRLAAAPSGMYNGIFDAVRKISRTEGTVRPFYKGLNCAMIANLPTSGLNLTLYESMKEVAMKNFRRESLPSVGYMSLGAISAFVTCSLLYPLQVVTSRQIMSTILDKENQNKGMINQIKKTYKLEGAKGFYKGYSPAITKVMLGNAMSFGCYEFMKKCLGIDFKKH